MIALAFGSAGVVVPGLPATPFFLLALFCFTKGSRKLNHWFRGTKLFEKYVKPYEHDPSLTRKQKLTIQMIAGIMMMISFIMTESTAVRLFLAVAFLLHNSIFIFKIKTREAGSTGRITKSLAGDKYEL